MKNRRKGGSLETDVTKIAYAIKAAKQYENGRHLRPVCISIIYGNGVFLRLMAIRNTIKNVPPLLPLYPQIRNLYIILCFFVSYSFKLLTCDLFSLIDILGCTASSAKSGLEKTPIVFGMMCS